jgi:hypothetical protein
MRNANKKDWWNIIADAYTWVARIFTALAAVGIAALVWGMNTGVLGNDTPPPSQEVNIRSVAAIDELTTEKIHELIDGFLMITENDNRIDTLPGYLVVRYSLRGDSAIVYADAFADCGCAAGKAEITRYVWNKNGWKDTPPRRLFFWQYFNP